MTKPHNYVRCLSKLTISDKTSRDFQWQDFGDFYWCVPVSQQSEPVNQQFRRENTSYADKLIDREINNNNLSDFGELKDMIKGFVQQMSTMLNLRLLPILIQG